MKKIVLFGAGGLGKEVANMILQINKRKLTYDLLGFVVESKYFKPDTYVNGLPVLGDEQWLLQNKDVCCCCTIANVHQKARIQDFFSEQGIKFETIVDVTAHIAPFSNVGDGCIIYPYVLVSSNVTIEKGVLLNSYVTVGHDACIGKYSTVQPTTGISGNVKIGEKVSIGGHAFIVPGKKIGDEAVVAAGSIVFGNVKANTTVLGNPAKRMRAIED